MAGQLTIDTLKASSGVLATQNGMTGIAKAWVNFNGVASPPTINGSFNVGSITKNASGDYTLNFTTAMADANYAICGATGSGGAITGISTYGSFASTPTLKTTSQLRIVTADTSSTNSAGAASVIIFD